MKYQIKETVSRPLGRETVKVHEETIPWESLAEQACLDFANSIADHDLVIGADWYSVFAIYSVDGKGYGVTALDGKNKVVATYRYMPVEVKN